MGKKLWKPAVKEELDEIDILDFFDSNENSNFLDEMPSLTNLLAEDPFGIVPLNTSALNNELMTNSLFQCDIKQEPLDDDDESENVEEFQPRVIQVNNYQNTDDDSESKTGHESNTNLQIPSMLLKEESKVEDELPFEVKYACPKSLFNVKRTQDTVHPWESDMLEQVQHVDDCDGDKNIELMNEYEENEIYKRLKAVFDTSSQQSIDIPPWIRRHYRKLCVRRMQRNMGIPIFNVAKFSKKAQKVESQAANVLDRFHQLIAASGDFATGSKANGTFMSRLIGSCKYELFVSPHTERILHPFVYRNDSCCPPWVRMLCELQYEVNGTIPSRSSMDYCYVRPQHIPAVNALLQRLFWPGIDSECPWHLILRGRKILINSIATQNIPIIIIVMSLINSVGVLELPGLQYRRSLQEAGGWLRVSRARCRPQRGLRVIYGRSAGLATGRHRVVHAVPFDANVHRQGHHVACGRR